MPNRVNNCGTKPMMSQLSSYVIAIFTITLLLSSFASLAYADQTALNQNPSILDNKKINPDGINDDRNKPDTISISENVAVTVHHKYVNPQDNTVTEKVAVYTSLNQNSLDIIKQNSDVKTIMDRISNLDRIRFNGRSIISENTLSNQEIHVEKLSSLMKPESEVYSPINATIKNNLATSNQILSTDLFAKGFSQDLQHDVNSLFLISDVVGESLLFFIHDLSNAQNPTMFLLLVPFSGYILIRAEDGKFQFNKKRSLSFCFIMIIVISSFTTPLLTSENYWGMAFAESNSTENNVNSTQSNNSNLSLTLNSNANPIFSSSNATTLNPIFSNSTTYPVNIHNVTQSWQFDTSLQNLTMVGKAKIENDSNITSLNLVGAGYVVTKNNSTRNLSALTISAWVKPDYSQGSPIFTIVSKENQFVLSINNVIPPVHTATFSIFDGIKWQTVNSTVLIGENWTHLAATFNGTTIGIYVNGTLRSTLAITGVPTIAVNGTLTTKTVDQLSSNSDIVVGASLNSLRQVAINQFSGSIENVNLYDSQLSPFDIAKMYHDNPLSNAFDISSLSSTSNLAGNLTMSSNTTTSLTIPLNNTFSLNNVTTVANFTLIHAPIQINKPVIWTQNVTLSNQTNGVAVELPQDAHVININVTNNTNSSTIYAASNSTTYSSILQSSTGLTNDVDIKTRHISKLEFVNDTNSTINKMTYFAKMRYDAMTIASLNNIPGSVQSNKPTKLLVVNDTAKRYNIRFETPAPYVVETNESTSQLYHKTVIVEHNSTLHYTNVQSYSNVPENLVSKGIHFKLFWMINGSKIDVTNDSRFAVQFVDTNNNGIVDQMKWIVPRLSAQEFSIEGIIIPISNAQFLDSNRNFVEDVYPQVQARDGNWTGDIPVGNYIRVTFGKNLTNINDITIFAKSNYSDASIEVYQKDSNQLLAHFGTISQDGKYKILLTDLNGSANTFDLKIVGNPINFDYIVDPSFSATPSDTLAISESAKMPQKTVTDTLTISESAKMSQKTVIDTLPLSDKALPSRSAKDTFAISESASVTTNLLHFVSVTDALPLSDNASQNVVAIKDTLPLSDKVSPNVAVTDTFAINESGSVSNSVFYPVSVTDTLPLSDKLSPNVAVTDTFAINESLLEHGTFSKSLSESVSTTDTLVAFKKETVSLSESVSTSDAVAIAKKSTVSLFESIVTYDLTGQNIASNQILVPNTQTTVTVDPVKTNVIISSSNATLSTVIIPSTVTTAQLNYSKILQTGITNTMQINNPVTIIKDNVNSQHVVQVNIPGNITFTGPTTWNGDISLPTIVSNPPLPQEHNVINTPSQSIALGLSNSSLTFNKAIRMSFTGDAGLRAGYFNSAVPFTEITTTCTDDTQTTNDALPAGGTCKINVGHDLIVWTKHFTSFTTWSSSSSTSSTSISVSGTGNSGGGATGVGTSAAAASSTSNGGGAGPYLKIQKISYDVCDKQIVQIQIGTDVTDVDPMVIIRTSLTGVVNAKLVPDQPYAQENVNATIRKLVYEATINPKEKSFEVVTLEYVGHNMFSFGKTVEITGCNESLDFTKLVTPVELDQIDLSAPRIFDFKFQLGNGTQQLASDSETPFVSGAPLSVYAIVDTPTQLVTSELRFTGIESNDSAKYNAVTMNVTPLQVSNSTYLLSAMVPSEFLQSPGIQYWIHVENSANKDIDSDVATMGVQPVNPINATIELDVPQTTPAAITTLSSYIANNGDSLYGVVSLVVDNKTVYDSPPQVFGIGQTKVDLQWDSTVLGSVSNHQVYAVAKFYDKSFETIPTTLDVFRSVQTVPLSQPIVLGPLKNSDGVIVANPTVLYSSFNNSNNMTYKVTAPDGTCVIGASDNCLVTQSTGSSNSKSIVIGDQIYRVRYSGPTSQLERFSIISVDPIIGQWKMEIDSQDGSVLQDNTMDNVFLKVKYDSP